jgi:photosystem II stability/assembly factor-like uncharacterized protein
LVIDPSNPAILYAGTGGASSGDGVYKSADGGVSWRGVWNGAGRGVRALAIAPSNPAVLYVATGNSGVYKSADGGASWTAVNIQTEGFFSGPSSENTFFCALAIDPVNSAIVYAGACGGYSGSVVLKSADGGESWTAVNNGLRTPDTSSFVNALAIEASNPATIYAGAAGGVFKSTDGGGSWTAANNGLPNRSVSTLAIDPVNPATLYAASGGVFFKSTNGGTNWSAAGSGLRFPVSTLAINPVNPTTIYAGTPGSGVFKSTDGGATWQPTGAD